MVVQHRTRVGLSDHLTGHPQPAVSLSPPNVPEPAQPPLGTVASHASSSRTVAPLTGGTPPHLTTGTCIKG
jgi:hypothetical protein